MFCGKCGTKLDDGAKFCGKCGSKIKESYDQNVKNKEEVKLESNEDNKNQKNKKAKKIKKKKKTKKISKPKKAIKQKKNKKERKPIKWKIIIPIILGIIISIVGAMLFVWIKFGDVIFVNIRAKSCIENTFKSFETTDTNLGVIPNLFIVKDDNSLIRENDIFLTVNDAKGIYENDENLSSLNGLSVNLNNKHDRTNKTSKTKISILNNEKDEIYGEISSNDTNVFLDLGRFYDKKIGIILNTNNTDAINTSYYNYLADISEVLFNYKKTIGETKNAFENSILMLVKEVVNKSKYKLESKDEIIKEKVYTTEIANDVLSVAIKDSLSELNGNEFYRNLAKYYTSYKESRPISLTDVLVGNKFDEYVASVDKAFSEGIIEPIKLKFIVDENNIIKDISSIVEIDGIILDFNFDIINLIDKNNISGTIKFDIDGEIIELKLDYEISKITENSIKRMGDIVISSSFQDDIVLKYAEEYDFKTNMYGLDCEFKSVSEYSNINYIISLDGKYEETDGSHKLIIDSLKANIVEGIYNIYIDCSGYISDGEISNIESIDINNTQFIDNLSENEIDKIKDEVVGNFKKFLELFGNGEW